MPLSDLQKNRLKTLAYSSIFALTLWVILDHISYSHTNSLRYNFFMKRNLGKADQITKGDYVTFDKIVLDGKNIREIKEVVCAPGDTLKVVESGFPAFYCNDKYLGIAKDKSPSGKPVPKFRYDGVIPAGSYFVQGAHENSYDSRYYGFISRDQLKQKFWPIF